MPGSVQVRQWDAKNSTANQPPKEPAPCTTTWGVLTPPLVPRATPSWRAEACQAQRTVREPEYRGQNHCSESKGKARAKVSKEAFRAHSTFLSQLHTSLGI